MWGRASLSFTIMVKTKYTATQQPLSKGLPLIHALITLFRVQKLAECLLCAFGRCWRKNEQYDDQSKILVLTAFTPEEKDTDQTVNTSYTGVEWRPEV